MEQTNHFQAMNQPQTNPQAAAQLYPNQIYQAAPMSSTKENTDNIYTRNMKKNFPFFGLSSFFYAIFYTFCLYRNASGITYPFFVAGTLCYFFFSMSKLGVPYKKDSIFYIISILLLGISNCMTGSPQILLINKLGIFLLSFILILHTVYNDNTWNLPKYVTAICQTIGTCFICLLRPFGDMISYFDAQKQQKTGKKSYFLPVCIGIVIAIPLLFVMILLLTSADIVFANMFQRFFETINIWQVTCILFLITAVFFSSYTIFAALGKKNVTEEVTDKRIFDPIIAIVVTAALSVLYLMFSIIQIIYLFIGNMQLPAGYTYASYAREGFFQLLTVCILNLLLVLICLYLFRDNMVLKIVLTIISGCTYIMILSSALRMLMYIDRYHLTFKRIQELWTLAVIFLLMTGVTIFIYHKKFPLFAYGMAVVTVFYIALSFSHPDYWIARYNLTHEAYTESGRRYLSGLSSDAAPAILNPQINPDITDIRTTLFLYDSSDYTEYKTQYNLFWTIDYYNRMEYHADNMHLRNFNFSHYQAQNYLLD